MFSKKNRLSTREFSHTLTKGNGKSGKYFYIKFLKNDVGFIRIGVAVSRGLGKKPSQKNYYKRVLRGILRETLVHLDFGYDIVLTAKDNIKNKKFEELKSDAIELFRKTNIFK